MKFLLKKNNKLNFNYRMNPLKSLPIQAFGLAIILFSSCNKEPKYDASGAFEAVETIISAQANGTLKQFNIEEGQILKAGQEVGYIDSTQLYLAKKQLGAQVKSVTVRKPDVALQLASLKEQLKSALRDKNRFTQLVKADAATQKQLDDVNAQVAVLQAQIKATTSTLDISTNSIDKDVHPIKDQIAQLEDQLNKCKIINPINGTVLTKYVEQDEIATIGKPLYKIADLSIIILRIYITGDQLAQIKLNQKVKVLTDDGKGGFKETEGVITWINDKAEFTPKTIQTKDERANLVYAVKVNVKNEGSYKIGMYGEVKFN